ncbi:hypothetical protein Tco_1054347 [Tanacetum coccineum]|uniref:Uncharacterized protein n=1 Tax=Tanacetum coccineum TaxID=301880 RepID=A0ABQ5GX62_9ASTR
MLSETDYAHDDSNFYGCARFRLAFDPTKSPNYKVVRAEATLMRLLYKFTLQRQEIGACVGSGEREEDSFLVMNLFGKVVQYNLISKTVSEIYDMGSNEVADDYLQGFIPPFAMYDMGYKKLDHKVYEFIPSSASV